MKGPADQPDPPTDGRANPVTLGRDRATRPSRPGGEPGRRFFQCVCCEAFTLNTVDECGVCPECGWEDWYECHDSPDAAVTPNRISLNLARSISRRFGPGACCEANWEGAARAAEIERMPEVERARLRPLHERLGSDTRLSPWEGETNAWGKYPCPCCGHRTMHHHRGSFDLCPVCNWEDDDAQWRNPDLAGGANSDSLRQARLNFDRLGASDERSLASVRPPNPDELPRHRWPA